MDANKWAITARGFNSRSSNKLLALGIWLLSCGALPAQTLSVAAQEYQVKAAFLYNFAKFVDWPGEPAGTGAPPPGMRGAA